MGSKWPRVSIRSGRVKRWHVCGQACVLKKISEWMGKPAAPAFMRPPEAASAEGRAASPLAAIERHIGPEGQDITAGPHVGPACAACGDREGGCPQCDGLHNPNTPDGTAL